MTVAHYFGLTPKWVDGTAVGGCSFMIHVRHAAAAIASGFCETVLITHGESGRSGVGRTRNVVAPTSLAGQFEQPYGPMGRRLWGRAGFSPPIRAARPRPLPVARG
jgi:acetyl-CoA acetyltransferase